MYGDNYGYRSGLNNSMVAHLEKKVKQIEENYEIKDQDLIVDIGSNDCTTLKAYSKKNLHLVGIDPTGEKFREFYPEDMKNYKNVSFTESISKAVEGSDLVSTDVWVSMGDEKEADKRKPEIKLSVLPQIPDGVSDDEYTERLTKEFSGGRKVSKDREEFNRKSADRSMTFFPASKSGIA